MGDVVGLAGAGVLYVDCVAYKRILCIAQHKRSLSVAELGAEVDCSLAGVEFCAEKLAEKNEKFSSGNLLDFP